ncbi:MAG: hypothetical protein CMM31_08855 [Rhodospirillaceae bacterium]|nr:hypothetical protein [Rhodospirillaceae bacterium]
MSVAKQNSLRSDGGIPQAGQASFDLAVRCNAELYRTFQKQIYAAVTVSGLNVILVTGVVWNSVPSVPLIVPSPL